MEVSSTTKENGKVLQGVCAYVEVRSKFENRSNVIAGELRKLGAEINEKLNNSVTHVVFKDGTNRTWDRAKKLDIPVVSVLWVDGCKKTLEHISERAFPAESPHTDEPLRLFPVKKTKFRSMQPKDLTEEFEESSQRCHRRRKQKDRNKALLTSYSSEPEASTLSPCSYALLSNVTTPPSMKAKMLERSKIEECKELGTEADDLKRKLFDNEENKTPEIFRDLLSNSSSPGPSSGSFTEMLPPKLLLNPPPHVTSRKARSKSFGIPSFFKPPSKQTPNRRKSMTVSEQKIIQDSPQNTPDTPKRDNVCDSTSINPSQSTNPLSTISDNTRNQSMEDFISNKPVNRRRYKHRETLSILGINSKPQRGIKRSINSSDQSDDGETSQEKHTVNATDSQSLSPSETEQMPYNKRLKEDVVLFCSTPSDQNSSSAQSSIEERLNQLNSPKTNDHFDNLSVCSSQSTVYSVSQAPSSLPAASGRSEDQSQEDISIARRKRNNTIFQKPIKKYLVMTSMSSSEQEMIKSVAGSLSGSVISDHVRKSTTHVICGNARRTLNLLYGMTQGCWLVSKQWVVKSMEAGKWIDERKFEMNDDYPSAKIYRQNKQKNCSLPIFESCGPMFISPSTAPPRKDLVHFVQFCRGQVENNMCDADFYVGEEYNPAMLSVSPQWILDSITQQRALPLESYQLGQPKPPSPVY